MLQSCPEAINNRNGVRLKAPVSFSTVMMVLGWILQRSSWENDEGIFEAFSDAKPTMLQH